jgi:tetratricopeptide (TPR) repeat protein
VTIRALKDEAQRLFVKGKFLKATDAYWKLIERDATDPQLRLRHAESSRRAALPGRAVASYRVAAQLLAQLGHVAKAQAALKMALELAPRDPSLEEALRALGGRPPSPPPPADPLALEIERPGQPADFERRRAITLESFQLNFTEIVRGPLAETELPAGNTPVARVALTKVPAELTEPEEDLPTLEPLEEPGLEIGDEAYIDTAGASGFTPQIRRLDACTIAFKPSPNARWVQLHSREPIDVKFLDELEGTVPDKTLERTFSGELSSEAEFQKLYGDRDSTH